MPAFCVEVKPRKSSAVSGIRSAPGICAAVAISFGSERLPSKPPPAKPRRVDVTRKSFDVWRRFAASAMWARTSERSRIATSFASSRVSAGRSGSARRRRAPACLRGGRRAAASPRRRGRAGGSTAAPTRASRRAPPATPGSRRRSRRAAARARRARAEVGPVGADGRGEDLVVQRRHEHEDAVRGDDADAVEQVLLRQRLRVRGPRRSRAARELVDELVDPAAPTTPAAAPASAWRRVSFMSRTAG